MQNLLEKAAELCLNTHRGQRDKMGQVYLFHPFRVALACDKDEEKIVALLHDVLEDSNLTPEQLLQLDFPQEIVDAVIAVTKQEGESYEAFIARAKQNAIGRVVKLRDLEDNLNALRLDYLDNDMYQRFNKYLAARRFLLDNILPAPTPIEEVIAENKNTVEAEANICSTGPERRPVITTDEYFRNRREESNRYIWNLIDKKVSNNLGSDNLQVIRYKQPGIYHAYAIETLIEFIECVGYKKVQSLNIRYKGSYELVRREGGAYYKEGNSSGWYVLSNCSNKFKALYINKIAEAFNINAFAEIVSK